MKRELISRLRARLVTSDQGVGLVEVVISALVFALLAVSVAGVLMRTMGLTADNRLRATAANLVEREKDVALGLGYDALPPGSTSKSMSVDGDEYTLTQTIAIVPGKATASSCAVPNGARLAYKRISVVATWDTMGSAAPVRTDTVLAVPVAQVNSAGGVIAVPVVDRDGRPLPGLPVRLEPSGRSATTDVDGCAVFADVASGTYAATLNVTGYVGVLDQQLTTTGNITVVSGRITKPASVLYDRATSIPVSLSPPSGYSPVVGIGISLDGGADGIVRTVPGCEGTTSDCVTLPTVMDNRFPWAGSGYRLSAGTCRPEAAAQAVVAPVPGGRSPAAVLPLGGVRINAKASFLTLSRATITATRDGDSVCPAGESFAVASNATVTSAGASYDIALPYGTWDITLTSQLGSKDTKKVTVSPSSRTGGVSLAVWAIL